MGEALFVLAKAVVNDAVICLFWKIVKICFLREPESIAHHKKIIMHIKENIWRVAKSAVYTLLLAGLFACSSPTDLQLVERAKDYLSQNKMREARIELKNALQENPKHAEARYLLGDIYLRLGDVASAEKEFKRAIDAGWPEGQVRIGIARARLISNALQALLDETGVKDDYPVSVKANLYALHALAQVGLGRMDQAEQLMAKASGLDADALYVLKSGVLIGFATGDTTAANEMMKRAMTMHGGEQEILLLSAIVAASNANQAEARATYQKVVALDPQNMVTVYGRKARLSLAQQYVLNKKLDQAEAMLEPLFRQRENDPEVNYVGGFIAVKQGNLDLAEKRLLLVLKVVPEYVQAKLLLGFVHYAQGKYEQAVYYIARYVSAEPDNVWARKLLGRAYSKLGQRDNAQATLAPALENNAGDAELLELVGLLQLQAGDAVSGIKELERAAKLAPENLALKNKLVRAYIFTGETDRAVKALNAMLAEGGDKKQGQTLLISAHLKAKQYASAISIVQEMLQDYAGDPDVLVLAGNVYEASRNYSEARLYFKRALQAEPGHLLAGLFLARLEEFEGNINEAGLIYRRLVEVDKRDINALLALARLAEMQNKSQEMVRWLQQAAERAPQDIISRTALVEHYLSRQQLREVGLVLKEAVKIAPDDNALLALAAQLGMAEGRYSEALLSLNRLVSKVPDSIYARTLLAELYFKLDQQADARQQLGIVLTKQHDYVPALVLAASLASRSGAFDEALGYAKKVQKIQPDLYVGYELAGDALMSKNEYAAAKFNYEQAWQRKPQAALLIKQSDALARAGSTAEAVRVLLSWLEQNPGDSRVRLSLAVLFQELKQNSKSIENYEKLLKVEPDNAMVLNNLAWLYSLENNPRALELAKKASKLRPNDSGVQDTYGWILIQQGRAEEGRHILEKVIRRLPNVPEVQYHYAVALLKTGEVAEAHKILAKLIKGGRAFEGREEAEKLLE